MKIEELDKNLAVNTEITEKDIVWINIQEPPFVVSGLIYDNDIGYTRIPQNIAETVSHWVAILNKNTAGGRVRFKTDSKYIAICAVMDNCDPMPHFTLAGQSGFDVYAVKNSQNIYIQTLMPPVGMKKGYTSSFYTNGIMTEYTINFPLYDNVKKLFVALKNDAEILPPSPYKNSLPVVFYGSSITQGGCASRPGNCYQNILSRKFNMDYINLGYSGNCKAEQEMANYLSELPMSIFVCDYDHNAPSAEHLEKTHFNLYKTIRLKNPNLPIVFITAPNIKKSEEDYRDFDARRRIIYNSFIRSKKEFNDINTFFIDGEELFGDELWDCCTVDGSHPNDLGFYRMAKRISKTLEPIFNNLFK